MIPLFDEPAGEGKRDVLEGRLISLAVRLVRLGTNVVLDFGCWSMDEQSSLRWLFEREGAEIELANRDGTPRHMRPSPSQPPNLITDVRTSIHRVQQN